MPINEVDENAVASIDWTGLASKIAARTSPLELRRELAATGLLAVDAPAWGNHQPLSMVKVANLFRAAGAVDLDLRDVIGLGHGRLLTLANGRRHSDRIAECSRGRSFYAVCITEPTAGSDLSALKTQAQPVQDGYVIRGTKRYISRFAEATHYLVFAQVMRAGIERLTVFVVPAASPQIVRTTLDPGGLKGTSWGEIKFDDVPVSTGQRVGGEGQGFQIFHRHFAYWRTMMAALALGSTVGVLQKSRTELISRSAFGAPIGRFTHLQQEYARHFSNAHMGLLLLEDTCKRLERNNEAGRYAAMAKAEIVENAVAAAQWAQLMFGARGVEEKTGLVKMARDLAALRIADGPTDVLRTQVARFALSEDLYRRALGRELHSPRSTSRKR